MIKPTVYSVSVKPQELKAWRKKHKYSQNGLAKLLGVAGQTVYRWESGAREITSFLHLALRCIELEGGEKVKRAIKTKGR